MLTHRRIAAVVAVCLLLGAGGLGSVAAQVVGPDYVISPGDALQVAVFGEADLSKTYIVGPAGTIVLPMLGQVAVADLTLDQAGKVITQKLRELLRVPHVTVGTSARSWPIACGRIA